MTCLLAVVLCRLLLWPSKQGSVSSSGDFGAKFPVKYEEFELRFDMGQKDTRDDSSFYRAAGGVR